MLEKYDSDLFMLMMNKIKCMADGRRDRAILNKCESENVPSLFFLFDKDFKIGKDIHKIINYQYLYFIYLRSAKSY